jgi:pSer/pThr/pTyr-binding forkhead associated (FHA) protein
MAKIQVFFGGSLQSEHPLDDREEYSVGRAPDCDIVIDNLAVSRRHCVFRSGHSQWVIEDNHSANGTFVNGHRISVQPIQHQDRIVVGKHTLVFDDYGSGRTHQASGVDADQQDSQGVGLEERDATYFVRRDTVAQYAQRSRKEKPMVLVLEGRCRKVVPLDKDITLIGNGRHCDLRLDGWFIKGEQAAVIRHRYGFKIIHQGGWRATRLNGGKVKEAFLQAGDMLTIAGHKISFGNL